MHSYGINFSTKYYVKKFALIYTILMYTYSYR